MTSTQIEGIGQRVRASIASIERGEFVKCERRGDLRTLAEGESQGSQLRAAGLFCLLLTAFCLLLYVS